ncbi:MAG: hypothetical protein DRQ40_06750, partial [Gammaproteobacteria bacterium]
AGWDTAVASNGSSISYSAPTSTLAAGKYLVMYSERFDTTDITNNQRVEIQSRLLIDGLATTTGAGQTYVRKEDGSAGDWQRAAIVGGSAIINISNDDTELATRFYRTDSSSDGGGTTDRTPGWGGMTILRLDDSWNYARYNVSGETATVDTFNEVVWDQTAEEDTGFSRTGANITITNAGRYLVTYTIPITTDGGSDRTEYISKIQLDNTDVEGSYVSTYIRENQSTDDGVLSYVGIINVSASDVLDIKMDMTDGTITGHNMEEGSSIEILELPSGNETIIAEATTGEMNPVTLTEFAWDTTAFIDTDAFTMGAGTDSYVDVDVDGDYLFFAAQQTTNGGTRTFPSARFSVNDVISSSTSGGQFNRSGGADQGGFAFGGLLTNLSAGDDISLENIYIEVDRAAQTLNHGAMSGLRLGSVFSAPASEGSTGGTFIANGGLVEFDSSDSGETINPGNSHFYDVVFDNASGGWTLSTDATSTNNFILTNVSDFTNTQTVEVQGEFSTAVASTSTTWTGGVLYLNSETDYEINNKLTGGDDYGTLQVGANTDISMWNSSSTVYAVDASSSLYSQDHYATDGYLNIFGDYNRTSGTEYWSYATDFDGTDLSGGSERQTNVYIENSSVVTITDTFLEGIGTSTASTTVQNRGSGTYTVNISGGTTTLQYYDFGDLGSTGLSLLNANAITSLADGAFTPSVASGVGLTISSTTIDANPGLQIYRVQFATTTVIAATNVTQTDGAPVSYWWFRDSSGNIDGEAFDNDPDKDPDGDPGSIRWDDSSLVITVSGTVYQSDESSPMSTPVCDNSANIVRVVVENGSSYVGSCASADGSYSIGGVVVIGDPIITTYLDTNGGVRGATVTKTPTANITDLDIYQNHVITRHEDVVALTIADMATYDSNDDTDIPYIAATGTTDTLNIFSETELHIASSTTFSPSGDVTISGNASSSSADGSLHIDNNAVFVGYSTSTITLAGSLTVDDGATFTSASTTVLMNATTTGKTITTPASQEIIFNELIFNGVSGGWNINGDIRVVENINVSTGTVTGTSDVVIENGSMSGNGTVSFGSGTTTIENTNTLGGNTPWTFGNLVLGNGVVTGTTTPGGATTTILDTLTINTGHFLDAGNTVWVLSGTGDVFMEDGTFLYDTSTIIYNGTGAANILSTNYYNLILNALGGSPTYTATGLGVQVFGDLDIGNTGTTTVDFDTNDSALNIEGGVAIHTLGTFVASDSGATTLAGSYDNNGIFTSSGGVLTFDGSGVHTIAAGNSAFGSVIINGSGDFTVSEHATATSFTITAADDFTLASSQALAVGGTFTNSLGGADTIWTDSILHLYGGGNYEINASTIDDSYGTLVVGTDTDIRMWNSDASTTTVNSSGSIYSQDHDDVSGDLYIYGDYVKSSGSDYWSYAKDFDGTDISGSPRKVDVYIAANASTTHLGG